MSRRHRLAVSAQLLAQTLAQLRWPSCVGRKQRAGP